MSRKNLICGVALCAALVGCASTGAHLIGQDTYLASARSPFSGESGAKSKVLSDADASCHAMGKSVKLVSLTSHECALHGGCGEAEATYMCLAKDDPRFAAN
jgi:hypothetical protein